MCYDKVNELLHMPSFQSSQSSQWKPDDIAGTEYAKTVLRPGRVQEGWVVIVP